MTTATASDGFFTNMRIKTKILSGSALILLILLVISLIATKNFQQVLNGFETYQQRVRAVDLVREVERDFLDLRRYSREFSYAGAAEDAVRVRELAASLDQQITAALAQSHDSERLKAMNELAAAFKDYMVSFDRAVLLKTEQNRLIREVLDPTGARLHEVISAFAQHTAAAGHNDGLALSALEHVLLARLYANQYVGRRDKAYADKAENEFANAQSALTVLDGMSMTTEVRQALDHLKDMMAQYDRAFEQVVVSTDQVNELVFRRMADEARTVANDAMAIKESGIREGHTIEKETEGLIETSKTVVMAFSAAGLAVGLVMSWLIGGGIAAPVIRMADTMRRLADGDLDAPVPALGRRDEVGQMADAVQVFKDNGIEKKRMDEAEKLRLEEERREEEAQRRREQAIAQEIATLIEAVSKGDLSRRLDLAGKDGFYRTMSEGINRVTDTIEAVVADIGTVLGALAQGDLSQRITKTYEGAFETLAGNVNATSVKLAEIVGNISAATETISAASAEVSAGSSDLADRTEQQASSLEETAASMEELSATVRSNADNAQRANRMAVDARSAAEQGGAVAGSAIEAMRRIEDAS
ncbi:MAG TPA: HAMP domain-containing protein, partial [Azospirillaceae bacterium]|nr:HAMP domain-containing protein [Azospirillaceae bacterium]